jgi:peptide chain release factor subunit 1
MFAEVDLRELAELTAPERAFLSVYLSGPPSVRSLAGRFEQLRRALRRGEPGERDEQEHFDENVKRVEAYLSDHPLESGSLCLLACWAIDFFRAVPLAAPVADLVWIDSSPYIRPLAELQEEYENVAVVVADNKRARIYLVASAVAGDETTVKGNVKNHVKKGGWSQQRYERRRDGQLQRYAREIVDALRQLARRETFRRVILVGGKEVLRIIRDNLPPKLRDMAADRAVDLGKGQGAVNRDIMDLFTQEERRSEEVLWERIRAEYLRGGLGAVGVEAVLAAALAGRVDTMIIERDFRPEGRRCRDCEHLSAGSVEACPACGSASLFEVDVVNELVELAEKTGAEVDFTDPTAGLSEAGHVAALLRY